MPITLILHPHKKVFFRGKVSLSCNLVIVNLHFKHAKYDQLSHFLFFHLAWDLLRICVYGFKAFCEDFLKKHPDYFVSPAKKRWEGPWPQASSPMNLDA